VEDYYEILKIDRSADSSEIRAAYKKLAMQYHPDRNPDDLEAEEIFKKVNEAYHTLSNPNKKFQYDTRTTPLTLESDYHYREQQKRRYWRWGYAQYKPYKLDKEYFKIQALAFLVFIVISGFCFGIIHTANYVIQQKHLERWNANSQSLKKINALFISGKYNDAFNLIGVLKQKDPLEYRFIFTKDSLILELRNKADLDYQEQDFVSAVEFYTTIKIFEDPVRFETLRKISICHYYLGNYKESIQALKHLHNQRPNDLELVYEIGTINAEKLDNQTEALHYFTLGKRIFKENLTKVYGEAFELIVDPADVPDIYFNIFRGRARANLALRNFNEATTDCNWAIFLRSKNPESFVYRAKANAENNKMENACIDILKAKRLGAINIDSRKFCK